MDIKSNVYNAINIGDKKYYSRCYEIGYSISNALWVGFKVYANYEIEALEILLDVLIQDNQETVMFGYMDDIFNIYESEQIDDLFNGDFIQIDNYFINAGYLNIKECEI